MPHDHWYVSSGELVAATEVVLSADVTPFTADGVAECTITVSPFVPCTLLVNSSPYSLIPEDPHIVLTSDVPRQFRVVLAPLAGYWATPLLVEAT
jgi:hypothetical protein